MPSLNLGSEVLFVRPVSFAYPNRKHLVANLARAHKAA